MRLRYPTRTWTVEHEFELPEDPEDYFNERPSIHEGLKWASVGMWDAHAKRLVNWRKAYFWQSELPDLPPISGRHTMCRFDTTYEADAQREARKKYGREKVESSSTVP